MASKPTIANAAWATDTNFSSGPASGTPTKVNAGAGVQAQGWRPGDALGYVGAWFNYWKNQGYQWFQYVDDLHNSAEFLNKSYTWLTGMHRFTGGARAAGLGLESGDLLYTDTAGAASLRTRTIDVPMDPVPSFSGGLPVAGGGNNVDPRIIFNATGYCHLNFRIPYGCTLRRVFVSVKDVSTTAMVAKVWKSVVAAPYTLTQLGSTMTSSGAGTVQLKDTGAAANLDTWTGSGSYFVAIAGHANDEIQSLQIQYNDPGFSGNG